MFQSLSRDSVYSNRFSTVQLSIRCLFQSLSRDSVYSNHYTILNRARQGRFNPSVGIAFIQTCGDGAGLGGDLVSIPQSG